MTYVGKKPADIIATAVDTTTGTFSGDLTVDTSTLYVDSANNRIGVGLTNPSSKLQVLGGTSGLDQISLSSNLTSNTVKYAGVIMTNYADTTTALLGGKAENGTTSIFYGSSGTDHRGPQNHIFYTNASSTATSGNTERMRIDSNGNLLVGTTNVSPANGNVQGIALKTNNAQFSANANNAITLNRMTDDGNIIKFKKAGTDVGSIGVHGGTKLYIGSGAAGLRFTDGGTDLINPYNTSTNADADGTVNLGYDGGRFKDLYLSGGVYLGGTVAANFLSDYEEGTWLPSLQSYSGTPTFADSTYTKIGRIVIVNTSVSLDNTSDGSHFVILNLPFVGATSNMMGGFVTYTESALTTPIRFIKTSQDQRLLAYEDGGSTLTYNEVRGALANVELRIVAIYRTS